MRLPGFLTRFRARKPDGGRYLRINDEALAEMFGDEEDLLLHEIAVNAAMRGGAEGVVVVRGDDGSVRVGDRKFRSAREAADALGRADEQE